MIIVFGVVVLIGGLVLKAKYMFNPITFKQDEITRYEWHAYEYPAQIEYLTYEDDKGWTKKSILKDKNEILYIFGQMKKNQEIVSSQSDFFDIRKDMGKEKLVIIRHLESEENGEGPILFQFHYYENGHAADIEDREKFIPISDELKERLRKRTNAIS
ncbi:hypothetical protein [Paenibacillus montanisoli]|uniref:Uncharacterized protein n=1 Tax=Paenibacillus montanisoli TaxID=2081970 RepID=A0A328U3S7_9BACL|nr:hypothetical protein [Paenibacillus montanisoli]RAP77270.1 hypothetical protein DL346_01870 [Paenibacillus montanisoli]